MTAGAGDLDFHGRTILVTGSGRNIGRAIIREFASRGANVVINVRSNTEEASEVAKEAAEFGASSLVVVGEPGDPATVQRIKDQVEDRFGHLDMYVSNAARRLHKTFFETTDEDWHYHLNQQLTASWYLAKAFVPAMIEQQWGRIIHINGPDGYQGGWTRAPHSVAKAGLRNLTKSLAEGLGQYGITVNDVSPGFIDTVRDMTTHPGVTAERTTQVVRDIPIRRQPTMDEMAWACAFLCSPRSGGITGTIIHVDGGQFRLG
jgi:3-oxoacyl-[acyl-carrier protein] reductase